MNEFLATLLEWFAVMTMSLIGVDYQPPAPCPTAEYREAVYFVTESETLLIRNDSAPASNCASLNVDYRDISQPVWTETA